MNKKEIIVENDRKIVDIIQDFGFSFADVNKMLRNKDVKLDGRPVKENCVVSAGTSVTFFYSDDMLEKKFEVIYENGDVFVVFKRAGIETDGEKGVEGALKGAIAVHRLDRNTEGLVVFAKNNNARDKLLDAFKNGKLEKAYIAEVVGKFDCKNQMFEAYLMKDSEKSFVKISNKKENGALKIKTLINTIKSSEQSSLLEIGLLTGRTHQIRAHLAFLGHPIIGDGKYGKNSDNKKFKQTRQKLACYKLTFQDVGIEGIDNKAFTKLPKWADGVNKK